MKRLLVALAFALMIQTAGFSQSLGVQTVRANLGSVSGTTTLDASTAGIFAMTLVGNTTLSVVNATQGETVTLVILQDATGSRTLTWPTSFNGAPIVKAAASAVTGPIEFQFDGTVWNPATAVNVNQIAAYTNATTTFSSIPELGFTIAASRNAHAICRITWQGSAGTTGPKYQFTGPAAPTAVAVGLNSVVTATTVIAASATAFSSAVANTGTITSATNFTDTLDIGVINGTTAGIVQLQAAANGVGTLTVQQGSGCVVNAQ